MNAHEMEKFCKVIIDKLWDADASEKLFVRAAEIVSKAAGGNFTLPFTEKVIAACKAEASTNDGG